MIKKVDFSNNTTSSQLHYSQNDTRLSLIVLILGIKCYTIYDQALYKDSSQIEVGITSLISTFRFLSVTSLNLRSNKKFQLPRKQHSSQNL